MENKSESSGLGLGLDINLRLGELQSTLTQLTDALQQTGEKVGTTLSDVIRKLRDAGVQDLKKASSGQHGKGPESDTYQQIVSQLQDAAHRGEDEARKLLGDLGEKVESAGEKTQRFAEKPRSEATAASDTRSHMGSEKP